MESLDPQLQQILLGVIANGLWSGLARGGRTLPGQDVIAAALDDAIDVLTDVPAITPSLGGESLRRFLNSPECRTLLAAVYRSQYAVPREPVIATAAQHKRAVVKPSVDRDAISDSIDTARAAFRLQDAFTGLATPEARANGSRLFDVLVAASTRALERTLREHAPSAVLDGKAEVRHKELLAEVRQASSMLAAAWDGTNALTLVDLDAFATHYLTLATRRYGTITPPSFDEVHRIAVERLFVWPRISRFPGGPPEGNAREVDVGRSLAKPGARIVVLGNPGAGKSTLAAALAYQTAKSAADLDGESDAEGALPFVVVLREYAAARASGMRESLVEHIERFLGSSLQLVPPKGALEHVLASGRAYVIFDGLDELLDTSYRRQLVDIIESFCTRYPACSVLVTSRTVGYDAAPLAAELFDTCYLREFDERRVHAYVQKWFAVAADAAEASRHAESFMKESEAVTELRRNPLMLALLCSIYRGHGYIPRNRPAVYEKCAVMLFDRWDLQRHIVARPEFERHLRPTMQHLAHWIYSRAALRGGVTERRLVHRVAKYLKGRRFDDEDEAAREAARFVEFCRGRAWVFTDSGLAPNGDRLYQFTHRTFLEFFTAEDLVRKCSTPAQLARVLGPRVAQREWDMVAQLALQLQDERIEGAGDQLLRRFLANAAEQADPEAGRSLDFAARALAFLVPSPTVSRMIGSEATERVLRAATADAPSRRRQPPLQPQASLDALMRGNWENAPAVAEGVLAAIESRFARSRGRSLYAAADIGLNLHHAFDAAGAREQVNGRRAWLHTSETVAAQLPERILSDRSNAFRLRLLTAEHDLVSLADVVKHHGLSGVFSPRASLALRGRDWPPLHEQIVRDYVAARHTHPHGFPADVRAVRQLTELGTCATRTRPPWFRTGSFYSPAAPPAYARIFQHQAARNPIEGRASQSAFDGLFAAAAVIAEVADAADLLPQTLAAMRGTGVPELLMISEIVTARFNGGQAHPTAGQAMSYLSAEAHNIALRWVTGRVVLVWRGR